jgi:hypothetical protein
LVPTHSQFGVDVASPPLDADIPPLIVEPQPKDPDPIGPYVRQPGFGVIDPAPMTRYVTEDAYIRCGIASAGTVRFDDEEIGPAGSKVAANRVR